MKFVFIPTKGVVSRETCQGFSMQVFCGRAEKLAQPLVKAVILRCKFFPYPLAKNTVKDFF